jgi:ABC-type Na+ efflux pump permease subunit
MNLFGPILRFELVRLARQRRLTLWRTLYALALFAVIVITYVGLTGGGNTQVPPHELARFAQWLFLGLFGLQAAVALMLTPQWAADAITGEKERRTLPFLLLTTLPSREIVLGKLAARLAQLLLFVLAGLPILCFIQFLGGVEPLLVLVGSAALVATVLSLGCLSVLCSVYARTTKAATQLFGRVVGLYILTLVVGGNVLRARPAVGFFPGSAVRPAVVSVQDLFDLLDRGNPIAAVQAVANAFRGGGPFGDVLWSVAGGYLLFHLAVAAVCGAWAVLRLRPVAAHQGDGPPPPARSGLRKPLPRPPVGDRPVLWKALHLDFRQYRTAAGRVFVRVVFLLSFAPMLVALAVNAVLNGFRGADKVMNVMCRGLGTMALCGMALVIAQQASASIGRERRRQTLDELLLTDLSTDEILSQKWLGSVGVVRWGLVWVAVHWLVGVLTGGLHILAVPVLALEWVVYAAFAASLGMYFAARTRTLQQANAGTGLVGFAAVVVPLGVGMLILAATGSQEEMFILPIFLAPPAALGLSAFSAEDLKNLSGQAAWAVPAIAGAVLGLVLYGWWAWRLWRGARRWFPRTVGRA